MRKKNKLVWGWGVNDLNQNVYGYKVVNNKHTLVWTCPYYAKWKSILQRCFDSKYQERKPTYKDCTICEDWKYLSNFIRWVDSQPNKDWQNCEPDKDISVEGNKHYSPYNVVFIPRNLNTFTKDSANTRGDYKIGVSYRPEKNINHYQSYCRNPFTGKLEHIGYFPTELEAHKAWQAKKHEHALKLSDLQDDERVATRLREMYNPDTDWTNR